ncbi:MAG: hypothetical protein ABSF26_03885 [Thermoguttaceae bacterium]|jgi:hypothetical protein
MKAKPRRGLHEIRTRSGLAAHEDNPQRTFLRVASIELKKTLCRRVRDAARKRAAEMDAKIAELEREKTRLLATGAASSEPLSRNGFALKY